MALNKWLGIGRMTKDPELKHTQSGVPVCSFDIAMNRPYSSGNGEKETDFITVVTWRQSAEFVCKYFKKGDPIQIEGSIQSRKWQDNEGKNRIAIEISASNVAFVEGYKRDNGKNDEVGESEEGIDFSGFDPAVHDDDLPF